MWLFLATLYTCRDYIMSGRVREVITTILSTTQDEHSPLTPGHVCPLCRSSSQPSWRGLGSTSWAGVSWTLGGGGWHLLQRTKGDCFSYCCSWQGFIILGLGPVRSNMLWKLRVIYIFCFSEVVKKGIFENENIMIHVGQNLFNFIMTTLAWFTVSQIYSLTAAKSSSARQMPSYTLSDAANEVLSAIRSFEHKYYWSYGHSRQYVF